MGEISPYSERCCPVIMSKKKLRSADDYITNKILTVFAFSFLMILALMTAYRGYSNVDTVVTTYYASLILSAVGALAFIVCVIMTVMASKNGKEIKNKVFCAKNMTVFTLIFAVCMFCVGYFTLEGVKMMYVFVPAAAALILIGMLYPLDFLGITAVCSSGAILQWYLSSATGDGMIWSRGFKLGTPFYLVVTAIVLISFYAIFVQRVKIGDGKFNLGKNTFTLVKKNTKYNFSYLTAAFIGFCVFLGFICGGGIAYYLIFVSFAYLFIMAVYYTIKMM